MIENILPTEDAGSALKLDLWIFWMNAFEGIYERTCIA